MKGKKQFTQAEAAQIMRLLDQKVSATRDQQKLIRQTLRDLGFYISDFTDSTNGFTLNDFETLINQKRVRIVGDVAIASLQSIADHLDRVTDDLARSDETYIIDLCDKALGLRALRQHRFDFLLGDSGMPLPVDTYYPSLNLVIEYRERQHTEAVSFFDKRMTVSGVSRRDQRRIYDQRRREALPQHGIDLVELSCDHFPHTSRKRLTRRESEDLSTIRATLAKWTH